MQPFAKMVTDQDADAGPVCSDGLAVKKTETGLSQTGREPRRGGGDEGKRGTAGIKICCVPTPAPRKEGTDCVLQGALTPG